MVSKTKQIGKKSSPYFQFSIGVLRTMHPPDEWNRSLKKQMLDRMTADSLHRLTSSYQTAELENTCMMNQKHAIIEGYCSKYDYSADTNEKRRIALAGSQWGQHPGVIQNGLDYWEYTKPFSEKSAILAQVPFALCIDALQNEKIKARDFVVFVAIKSALGRNRVGCVTSRQIIARAAGYDRISDAELADAELITKHQLDTSTKRLESRNLIRRFTVKNRFTYYGIGKMSDLEFVQNVDALSKQRSRKSKQSAKQDNVSRLFEAIQDGTSTGT